MDKWFQIQGTEIGGLPDYYIEFIQLHHPMGTNVA